MDTMTDKYKEQMEEKTRIREQIKARTREQEREYFRARTGYSPYTEDWRFFNEGRIG